MKRLVVRAVLFVLLASVWGCSRPPRWEGDTRVIVLGIDGMDYRIVEELFAEGRLPNLRALAEEGAFKHLWSSVPPQSPVAWSNFITGRDPGGHGIFDFIHRDPATYLPYLSTSETIPPRRTIRLGRYIIPLSSARVELKREGRAFWEYLDDDGIPAVVFKIPSNYPPVEAGAGSLSGMGTPDLQGSYGIYQYYASDPAHIPEDYSGARFHLVEIVDEAVEGVVEGPVNTYLEDAPIMTVPFTAWLDPENLTARIDVQGREIILDQGQWSEWVVFSFRPAALLPAVRGIGRFYLQEVHPGFRLYLTPINVDPARPALPIDYPRGWARSLADEVGYFYTQGMAEDTKAFTNATFTLEEFVAQIDMVLEENNRVYRHLLDNFERGFLFFYFSTLDLGSHALWHLRDPNHPIHDPEESARHGDLLARLYDQMDEAVGRALEHVDENTTLIVMSDHGFGPFYRNFHLNQWLLDNGYLRLRRGARTGTLDDIDWSRTRAYGLGLNALYVNTRGREGRGIVSPGAERESLIRELAERLEALQYPSTGESVVLRAHRREEVYDGPRVSRAPDLMVAYDVGWRVSYESALGEVTGELFTLNLERWSGDHCGATEIVPGVVLSNRPIHHPQPHLYDLAPTILAEFGLAAPEDMIGINLFDPAAEEWEQIRALPYF